MPYVKDIIATAANIDPLTLAIVFTGLVSLGGIGLAALAIQSTNKRTRK